MAAIDPSAEPEFDEDTKGKKPRATLKIIRAPLQMEDEDSDFDPEEMDAMLASDDDEESEEEAGPSDPAKSKKARKAAAAKQLRDEIESMDVDSPKNKGKGKVQVDDEEDEDESDDEDDEEFEPEEFVLCTLDPENVSICANNSIATKISDNFSPALPTNPRHHSWRRRARLVHGHWYPRCLSYR